MTGKKNCKTIKSTVKHAFNEVPGTGKFTTLNKFTGKESQFIESVNSLSACSL